MQSNIQKLNQIKNFIVRLFNINSFMLYLLIGSISAVLGVFGNFILRKYIVFKK